MFGLEITVLFVTSDTGGILFVPRRRRVVNKVEPFLLIRRGFSYLLKGLFTYRACQSITDSAVCGGIACVFILNYMVTPSWSEWRFSTKKSCALASNDSPRWA